MLASAIMRTVLDVHSLHEVLAVPGQVCTAAAFVLALTECEPRASGQGGVRGIAWLRQDAAAFETGDLFGDGLTGFGIDPDRLIIVRLRNQIDVLRAALEAARCAALGAVIIELTKPIDLTASRRLKLAAEKSGVMLILLRHSDTVVPNAAQMRWRIATAPSAPTQSGAWGQPTFDVMLLKHPSGLPQTRFLVEWDCDRRTFVPALPQSMAAVSVSRSLAA